MIKGHSYNERHANLERMMNILADQMGSLEKVFMTEVKRNKTSFDMEQTAMNRLENTLKIYEDNVIINIVLIYITVLLLIDDGW